MNRSQYDAQNQPRIAYSEQNQRHSIISFLNYTFTPPDFETWPSAEERQSRQPLT